MHNDNRFLNYSKGIQTFVVVFSLLALVSVVELTTLACVFFIPHVSRTNNRLFRGYWETFHPLVTGKLLGINTRDIIIKRTHEEYDPWLGYRGNHGEYKGTYAKDKMGFISNGDLSRDISEKAQGIYRIFILGGSTVAGCGTNSPKKSIAAYLERMLNAALPAAKGNKLHFQVINAGVPGWYSSQEAAFTQFELMYYKPDMIISFDGVNDTTKAEIICGVKEKYPQRYYWHSYHHMLGRVINDTRFPVSIFRSALARSPYNPARYSYFLNFLFYKLPGLLAKQKRKAIIDKKRHELKSKYVKIPKPEKPVWGAVIKNIEWEDDKTLDKLPASGSYLFANKMVQNWKNMKAVCQANGLKYIAILQPTLLPEFKKKMLSLEKFYYDLKRQNFKRKYKRNYRLSVLKYYDECSKLAERELDGAFFDFSKILYKEKKRIYIDWWHYNKRGNVAIASKIKEIVIEKYKKALEPE